MDPFALLDRLDGHGDSVLSPYGIRRALEVVRRGARGETRAALEDVLGPDETPQLNGDGLVLAQAAWLANGYTPGPALQGLEVGPLDVARVNAWASEKTHGMIPAVVERFARDEKLAITDAAYLDAKWRMPFERIGRRPFEGAGEVEMMYTDATFEHAQDAIRLPYGDGELRFVARLDPREGVRDLAWWRDVAWTRGPGMVVMPAFGSESRHDLVPALIELGLGPAFVPGDDLEDLFRGEGEKALSRILQRARVDVDDEGTRAAAVTVVIARAVSATTGPPPFELIFDRPFTWAIEHAPTQTLLFVGRVRHPRERSD
jgi:serine protease inhibitor